MAKATVLLDWLRATGLDAHGALIPGAQVRAVMDIHLPEVGTYGEFQTAQLQELSAVESAREALRKEGKHLAGVQGDYRILLPSENVRQAKAYNDAARGKMKRAQTLLANTPDLDRSDEQERDLIEARIDRWKESNKRDKEKSDLLGAVKRKKRTPKGD